MRPDPWADGGPALIVLGSLVGDFTHCCPRAILAREVAAKVRQDTLPAAIELAAAPELIAGYGPVEDAGVAAFRARVAELLPQLEAAAERELVPA